jgi:hypothetical protein
MFEEALNNDANKKTIVGLLCDTDVFSRAYDESIIVFFDNQKID